MSAENRDAKKQLKRRVRARTLRQDTADDQEFSNINEAWEHYNGQLLLLGEPGAGKTTTLLYHAQTLIENYLKNINQPLPVFATIAYWDSYAEIPLHEWLPEHNDLPADVGDLIRNGRAVLILDGLDELGDSKPINPKKPEEGTFDPRQRFMAQVQGAIRDGNQVLITCRVKDYNSIGDKLDIRGAIELQPLTDEQIETYLGDVPTVQAAVMNDHGLLDICRSPLLLSLIAFGYRDATDDLKALPSMTEGDLRDAIFGQYMQASYNFEASRRELIGEEMPFTLEQVLDVLGHAAMINVVGGERDDNSPDPEFFLSFGSEIIENRLIHHDFTHKLLDPQIDTFLNFIPRLNAIERLPDGEYRFLHLLIRDYLAYTYAMSCINRDKHDERATLFTFDDMSLQMWALTHLKDVRYVDFAINRIIDKDERRAHYIVSLGKIGDPQAVPSLIDRLQNDSNASIRSGCARALGQIDDPQAVPSLIDRLQNDSNAIIRSGCARALGQIGDSQAISILIDRLQNDSHSRVRIECAKALGQIGDAQAVSVLIIAQKDTGRVVEDSVAESATKALEKIGTAEALEAVAEWRKQEKERKTQQKSQSSFEDDNWRSRLKRRNVSDKPIPGSRGRTPVSKDFWDDLDEDDKA